MSEASATRPVITCSALLGRNLAKLLPKALELLLTGDPIDAETALAWGLIDEIVA